MKAYPTFTMPASPTSTRAALGPHPALDAALLGALAFPALAVIQALHLPFGARAAEISSLAIITPHYLPTIYRLYGNQRTMEQHRDCAWIAPVAIALALLVAAVRVTPFTLLFVSAYGVWRLYHYAAQAFGVSVLYAARSGQPFSKQTRFCLQALLFGSAYWCLFSHPVFFTAPVLSDCQLTGTLRTGVAALVALAAVAFAWSLRGWRGPRSGLLLVAVPVATHLFFLYETPRAIAALTLAGIFHSSQYLFITGMLARREAQAGDWPDATWLGRLHHSRFWLGWVLVGGAALFALLKVAAWCLVRVGTPAEYAFVLPVMAINFHHFLADGVLWKLSRRPETGLLLNRGFSYPRG